KIEHFQGEAVLFRDDFETDRVERHITGSAERTEQQAASGRSSLRLAKRGDTVEYRLPEPVAGGWVEARIFDSGQMQEGLKWVCEFEFSAAASRRLMQVLLGWDADSYGLATPQGPSLPVQHLARRPGWHRLGLRFARERTTVLLDDAVLAYG